jgi:hypothetical protein
MTNFTVLTDEQAAHDAATSKRYLEALREMQSKIADLEATEEGAKIAFGDVVDQKHALTKRCKSLEASITAMRDIISTQAARIAALEADAALFAALRDKFAYVGVNQHARKCLWVLRDIEEVHGDFEKDIRAAIEKGGANG